ncbi:conserved hypothetical protein [Bosea sp. 46]|nr:conserved hypothetical protein [Bosea sp. 21B]CAD5277791.1 conserved hypothetical protein [Bosea sp. 46]VXC22860.1 conserved hypothetical protein [Bosea sp. 29B]VXC75460.1 conserved hypothetical protein [Bosea sp. 125]
MSLYDVAEMNDALDVLDENTWRSQEASRNGR